MFGLDYDSIGDFGEIFTQFYHQPKEAIQFLKRVQCGECVGALYRDDIGDIDLIWGEVTDPIMHKGYGLAHIIDKHEQTINQLGFEIEDFLPIVVQYGNLIPCRVDKDRVMLQSHMFRVVLVKNYAGMKKQWILTAFNL